MIALIDAAFSRSKVVQLAFVFLLIVGSFAYTAIPKESSPEIPIPIVYVSTGLDGISPQDAEDVLVGPMETEFASLTGLKSMTASASEGCARLPTKPKTNCHKTQASRSLKSIRRSSRF